MKKVYLFLLIILSCVLAGCTAEEPVQKAASTGTSEDIPAELTENAPIEPKKDTSVETSEDSENFIVDDEQSFSVDVTPLGKIRFKSLIPAESVDSGRDAVFEIEKDGTVIQRLDDPYTAATMFFSKIEAVSFADYNNDGNTDIIVITSYDILGEPDTGTGTSAVKYYAADSTGRFSFDNTMSENANKDLTEFTIAAAKEYVKNNRTSASDSAICRQKYRESMQTLINEHVFPNGKEADDSFVENNDFSKNQFAVCDIDGDGIEELLISYSYATMVGMTFYIFQYDAADDALREELWAFPDVAFYEGGYLTVGISHNQGMAGEFWPYSIYRYDSASDSYRQVAFIDAWDGELFPKDYEGNAFPKEIDISNTGIVYYIYRDGNYYEGDKIPLDVTEYQKLVDETYGGEDNAVQVDFLSITPENISKI